MSVSIEVNILCDGCGVKFMPLDPVDNRKYLRAEAKERGWAFIKCMDRDYCQTCAEDLSKHINFR